MATATDTMSNAADWVGFVCADVLMHRTLARTLEPDSPRDVEALVQAAQGMADALDRIAAAAARGLPEDDAGDDDDA